jgi:NADPH:quinone reductase-like Zn-dependent oxidoreductase
MKAIVQNAYGGAEVLQLAEIKQPGIGEKQVLIRVHASAINAGDYFSMRGRPWAARFSVGFPKPKNYIPGWDVAGHVEDVGTAVTRFKPGDEVFGTCSRTFAEYVSADESFLAKKPGKLDFRQAACVPSAALTALQELREIGRLHAGQNVLINGASGGVGTFAVQIAKAYGANVTGVCSTRNVDMVRSIGADQVIDYTQQDFTQTGQRYDLILDNVGNRSFSDCRRALKREGILIPNTGHAGMRYVINAFIRSLFMHQQGGLRMTRSNYGDLEILKELIESGKMKPVIDRIYPLEKLPEAMAYAEQGHTAGKIVIAVG